MKQSDRESTMLLVKLPGDHLTRRAQQFLRAKTAVYSPRQYDSFANTRRRPRQPISANSSQPQGTTTHRSGGGGGGARFRCRKPSQNAAAKNSTGSDVACEPRVDKTHWNQFHTRNYRMRFTNPAAECSEDSGSDVTKSSLSLHSSAGEEAEERGTGSRAEALTVPIAVLKCPSQSKVSSSPINSVSPGPNKNGDEKPEVNIIVTTISPLHPNDDERQSEHSEADFKLPQISVGEKKMPKLVTENSIPSTPTESVKSSSSALNNYQNQQEYWRLLPVDKATFCGVPLLLPPVALKQNLLPYYTTMNPLSQQLSPSCVLSHTSPSRRNIKRVNSKNPTSVATLIEAAATHRVSVTSPAAGSRKHTGPSPPPPPLKLKYTSVPKDIANSHRENFQKLSEISKQNQELNAAVVMKEEQRTVAKEACIGVDQNTEKSRCEEHVTVKHSENTCDISIEMSRRRTPSPQDAASRQFKAKMCAYRQAQKEKYKRLSSAKNSLISPGVVGVKTCSPSNKDVCYTDNGNTSNHVLSLEISLPKVSLEPMDSSLLLTSSSLSDLLQDKREVSSHSAKLACRKSDSAFNPGSGDLVAKSMSFLNDSKESILSSDTAASVYSEAVTCLTPPTARRAVSAPLYHRRRNSAQSLSPDTLVRNTPCLSQQFSASDMCLNTNGSPEKDKDVANDSDRCSQCSSSRCDRRYCRYVAMQRPRTRRKSDSTAKSTSQSSLSCKTSKSGAIKSNSKGLQQPSKCVSYPDATAVNLAKLKIAPKVAAGSNKQQKSSKPRARTKTRAVREVEPETESHMRPGSVDVVSYIASRQPSPLPAPETVKSTGSPCTSNTVIVDMPVIRISATESVEKQDRELKLLLSSNSNYSAHDYASQNGAICPENSTNTSVALREKLSSLGGEEPEQEVTNLSVPG